MLSAIFFYIIAFLTFINALPLNARLDIEPPITLPNAQSVWVVGTQQNITWDTSVIPPGVNQNGFIVLGFLTTNPDSENLQLDNPLVPSVPLNAGTATITVPNVAPGDEYIVVLFGNSGNASPPFKIEAAS